MKTTKKILVVLYCLGILTATAVTVLLWTQKGISWVEGKEDSSVLTEAGWIEEDGRWRYRKEDGLWLRGGWVLYKQRLYYIGNDGFMVTGWYEINGSSYYFLPEGSMAENEVMTIGNKRYTFGESGCIESCERIE